MGPQFLAVISAVTFVTPDTIPTYADTATQRLVGRAMERHHDADSAVTDYRARIRYRLSFSLGRRRWAWAAVAAVEEQEGVVQWQRPNDLRLEILGRRARARSAEFNISSGFDRPWFVPRGLGDSVRIFGNDFPERAALHPLATDGPSWYRYAIVDSVRLTDQQGSQVRLIAVEVIPKQTGPALIAGRMWVDAASGEVVRLSFRYVGNQLWSVPEGDTHQDSVEARRENSLINRILSVDADLEYGLQEGRYWMPYRQVISGRVQIPLIGDLVIPFEAQTTFQDYEINTGRRITFTVPLPDTTLSPDSTRALRRERRDSMEKERRHGRREQGASSDSGGAREFADRWPGGQFEIHRAPEDSLKAYAAWGDSLQLDQSTGDDARIREVQEDLAHLAETLPDDLTGRRSHGIAYERFADIFRYNRVQGLSAGLGYQVRVRPLAFTTLQGTLRYGLSDSRLTARLSLLRDAPSGRWTLSGYREIGPVDPFTRGQTMGNSLNGLFAAHDNADYYLAQGGSLTHERSLGRGVELTLAARVEDQRSVAAEAHSGLNDLIGGSGRFPPNPAVDEGTFGTLGMRLEGYVRRSRWTLGGDGLVGVGKRTARVYGQWRQPIGPGRSGVVLVGKAGIATAPTLRQAEFRLGGLPTVRGFDYGFGRGQAFWSLQADWALTGHWIRPVVFLDAGQAGDASSLFKGKALVGGGVGLSILRGLVRFDLSHAVTPNVGKLRFDLVFQAAR